MNYENDFDDPGDHEERGMTTEAHLDRLYALVREQSDQIDDLLLAKDNHESRLRLAEDRLAAAIDTLDHLCNAAESFADVFLRAPNLDSKSEDQLLSPTVG